MSREKPSLRSVSPGFRVAFGLVIWTFPGIALAAGQALVEMSGVPEQRITAGERTNFDIKLTVEGQFSGPTYIDLPEVSGALLFREDERPVLSSRTAADTTLVTATYGVAFIAQRGGKITIPPITARFASKDRYDTPPVSHRLRTDPVDLEVEVPPGARGNEWILSSRSLKVTEAWSAESETLGVGDALDRTITLTARDIPAMLLPAPETSGPEGVSVYIDTPVVTDNLERGEKEAKRVDRFTYVFSQEGTFEIPALGVRWWDPANEQWQQEELPARTVRVTALPESGAVAEAAGGTAAAFEMTRFLGTLLLGSVLIVALWFGTTRTRLGSWWMTWRANLAASEAVKWRQLRKVCRSGNPGDMYRALNDWLACYELSSRKVLVRENCGASSQLTAGILALQLNLVGSDSAWSADGFLLALKQFRVRLKRSDHAGLNTALPEMNPVKVE